jgi:hypothetical protein
MLTKSKEIKKHANHQETLTWLECAPEEPHGVGHLAFPKERLEPLNDSRHVHNAIARFRHEEACRSRA